VKVAIHQPQYFPWPPYVHKIMSADIFVYLDTVQFTKNGLQNRNQIKTDRGAVWLTIPVKHHFGQRICDVEIADRKATRKHLKTIAANYNHSPGFPTWKTEVSELLEKEFSLLVDVAIGSTEWLLSKLHISTKRIRASELAGIEGESSKLVASICKTLGASSYLSGSGALAYLDHDDFKKIGCEVRLQSWKPFTYKQGHEQLGFIPDLSALDLILNCPDTAAESIDAAGHWRMFDENE
jgi:hypothetical protein